MPLILGDIVFADFEIPSKISGLGGKQTLAKHVLLGGARVTDAMGQEDGDPSWEGRFRGDNATDRAQALDAMRISGQEFSLSWGVFFYSVVIEEFTFDYERSYEIPYRIKCYITQVITPDVPASLDDQVSADLASFSDQVSAFSDAVD